MFKIMKLEWVKFVESRKNRLIFILLFLFLLGSVFYYQSEYESYFETQVKTMVEQRNKANASLRIIQMFIERVKEYKENQYRILYLSVLQI